MAQEIERKFIVQQLPPELETVSPIQIEQGYITNESEEKEVRLRRAGGSFWLTIKTKGALLRQEYEVALSQQQFDILWPSTEGQRLKKSRYVLKRSTYTVEVDDYHQPLKGLIVAEVEFDSESAANAFVPESWMGQDVTHLNFMKNKNLLQFDHVDEIIEKL